MAALAIGDGNRVGAELQVSATNEQRQGDTGWHSRIVREIEAARTKLLDTGTRNRLIHVNRNNRRANCLNIINERAAAVFDVLRVRGSRMRFEPTGRDAARGDADLVLFNLDDELDAEARHTDRYLETPSGPDALQKRLLRLAKDAKTAEEEQGINVLYLALGFLTWFETPSSSVQREAPLILLPVELIRDDRRSTYDIVCRSDDITTNLPLQERLKQDFGVALPDIDADDEDGFTPSGYFARVRDAIAGRERWRIEPDAMQLGFFSFAKLLMHHDLDPAKWADDKLTGNLIGDLLQGGLAADASPFGTAAPLDEILAPADIVQVVDADASQTKVIEEVRRGGNLVVQGPPGTGKSQTITNIIAAAVHDGRRVLFMAEKMAALSVVRNRLERTGLGDVCVELHSRSANKRALAQELGRTLSAGGRAPVAPPPPEALREARDRLNDIVKMLHDDLDGLDYAPFDAIAESVRFIGRGAPPPALLLDGLERLSGSDRQRIAGNVAGYVRAMVGSDYRTEHPFAACGALDLQPTDLQRMESELDVVVAALDEVGARTAAFRAAGLAMPETLEAVAACQPALDVIRAKPEQADDYVAALFDRAEAPRLHEALRAGEAWTKAKADLALVAEHAWQTPVAPLRVAVARGAASLFTRLFGFGYRRACGELRGMLRGELPASAAERLHLIDLLVEAQRQRALLAENEAWLSSALGDHWRGERTDFAGARRAAEWMQAARTLGVSAAEELPRVLGRLAEPLTADLPDLTARAEQAAVRALERLRCDLVALGLGDSPRQAPIAALRDRLARMRDQAKRYGEWAALGHSINAVREDGLGELIDLTASGAVEVEKAEEEFGYACAEARWRHARRERPGLNALVGMDRHELAAVFRERERDRLDAVPCLILARHREQLPRGADGEMGIIRGEINRKRRHKSIRRLMLEAGAMVQRIKPVFLMSPISIAQFLPPGALDFDVLVIDEASQVRPEDALGAIARARQIVVVGDQKQLPPTSFFDRLTNLDDPEKDDEEANGEPPQGAKATEMESVLTLCEARGLPRRMLEWHYRSRDPSLIRVSNLEFYDNNLVLPPSPLQLDDDYGLKFRLIPGVYSSRSRGAGRAGTNKIEAHAVVDAMARHAREWPGLSLGVVAFSKAQSDMMTEVLEHERRQDEQLDDLLHEGKNEDVFVKNIENVQGDERDVIFISVGYGPAEPSGRLTRMNFGPVNGEGGERRLNVLFSRARVRCEVFASFEPGDIDLSRTSREGPRVLKRFLEFAKSRRIDQRLPTGLGADSPFEEDVARVIRGFGYQVDLQVGSAGFHIDLGIRGRERPGQYILAVECDGATYHSALWARERDRLRQDVLESLGWRFHRIWSTDWFHRRAQEIERLRQVLKEAAEAARDGIAVRGANGGANGCAEVAEQEAVEQASEPVDASDMPRVEVPAYRKAELQVVSYAEPHEYPLDDLSRLVTRIVDAEGPIHVDEVARRVSAAFGKARTGGRIAAATLEALRHAGTAGQILRDDDFWMTDAQREDTPIRDRSAESRSILNVAALPGIEIRAAAKLLERESGRMESRAQVRAVARLLGFRQVRPDLQAAIQSALEEVPRDDVE